MTIVYRLMNVDAQGWRSSSCPRDWRLDSNLNDGTERWQSPCVEVGPLGRARECWTPDHPDSTKYWYGFVTLRDVCIWFNGNELGKLAEEGFHLYTADVPEEAIVRGGRQIAFLKDAIPFSAWSRVNRTSTEWEAAVAEAETRLIYLPDEE